MGGVLCGLVVVVPLLSVWTGSGTRPVPRMMMLAAAVALGTCLLVRMRARGVAVSVPRAVVVAVAPFLATLWVATAAAPSVAWWGWDDRMIGAVPYTLYAGVFVLAAAVATPSLVERVVRWWAVGAVSAAAVGIAIWLGWSPYHSARDANFGHALYGTLDNPDFAAAYLAIALPAVAVLPWLRPGRAWRWGSGFALALVLVAIWLTGALQGPAVVALQVTAVGLWLAPRLPAAVGRRVRVAAVPVLAGVALVALPGLLAGWGPLGGLYDAASMGPRLAGFRAAVVIAGRHPALGVGPGLYGLHYSSARTLDEVAWRGWDYWSDDPHSVPLNMLVSGGVPLAAAYLGFVAAIGWLAVRALRRRTGRDRLIVAVVAAMWATYQVLSVFGIDEAPLALSHWLAAGLLAGLAVRAQPGPAAAAAAVTAVRPRLARAAGLAAPVLVLAAMLVPFSTHWRMDIAEDRQGDGGVADRVANALLPWSPLSAQHYYAQGMRALRAGEPERGLAWLRRGVRAVPRDHFMVLGAARAAALAGRDAEAAMLYRRFVVLEPNAAAVLVEFARLELRAFGDARQAAVLTARALGLPATRRELRAARALCDELADCTPGTAFSSR